MNALRLVYRFSLHGADCSVQTGSLLLGELGKAQMIEGGSSMTFRSARVPFRDMIGDG